MKIEQTAGRVGIEVYTDGWPLWPEVSLEGHKWRGSVKDLHDLRYCIDRVLAQLPPAP